MRIHFLYSLSFLLIMSSSNNRRRQASNLGDVANSIPISIILIFN